MPIMTQFKQSEGRKLFTFVHMTVTDALLIWLYLQKQRSFL